MNHGGRYLSQQPRCGSGKGSLIMLKWIAIVVQFGETRSLGAKITNSTYGAHGDNTVLVIKPIHTLRSIKKIRLIIRLLQSRRRYWSFLYVNATYLVCRLTFICTALWGRQPKLYRFVCHSTNLRWGSQKQTNQIGTCSFLNLEIVPMYNKLYINNTLKHKMVLKVWKLGYTRLAICMLVYQPQLRRWKVIVLHK